MGFLSKQRSDGNLIKGGDPMMHIMPYLMRGRNESAIYYRKPIDIEACQNYIKDQRRNGVRITLFSILVTSLLHVLHERPPLNRFVAGRRLYEHKDMSVLYVVKTKLTDDGPESVANISFTPDDNIFTVAKRMKDHSDSIKAGSTEKFDDKLIHFFAKMPRFLTRTVVSIFRFLDFHGMMPKSLIDTIPMYSSVFISHLGSIGAEAPFHHLYEFGTTSIFITIGKTYEVPTKASDGSIEWRKHVDLCFTIDERICDGYYLTKSLRILENLIASPEWLENTPAQSVNQAEAKRNHDAQSATNENDDTVSS